MICKYSQLYKQAAATKDQILAVSKKLNKTPEEIVKLTSEVDPTKKYEVWLLKQMAFLNIILPEDKDSVLQTLKDFEQLNLHKQLKYTNINQYKNIADLKEEIATIKPKELSETYDYHIQQFLKLKGVSVFGQNSDYFILQVTDPESLTKLGDSTDWCTRHIENAKNYIYETGNQYVVFKKENNKYIKFAQFAQNFQQFQNINNRNILKNIEKPLAELILFADKNNILKKPFEIIKYDKQTLSKYLKTLKGFAERLDLSGVEIDYIENLTVRGDLDLNDCKIGRLENVRAYGNFYLQRATVNVIRGQLVTENLIAKEAHIKQLPEGFIVYNLLDLSYSDIETLPDNFNVGSMINLRGSKIKKLPPILDLPDVTLKLTDTEITELPEVLKVRNLFLYDTKIKKLPDGLFVKDIIVGENPYTGRDYMEEYLEGYEKRKEEERKILQSEFEEYMKEIKK